MPTTRTEQFELLFEDRWHAERLPIGGRRRTVAKETITLGSDTAPTNRRDETTEEVSPLPATSDVLYDDDMWVHYGFIYVSAGSEASDDLLGARAGQQNGLCGAQFPHQLSLVTGLHTGEVPLRVEWHPTEPVVDDSWDDVVEVSVEVTTKDALLSSFQDSVELTLPATGWHRARYCAAGMDEGSELDTPGEDEAAPDRYLLQMWPSGPAPDEIKRRGSRNADYWHGVAAGE